MNFKSISTQAIQSTELAMFFIFILNYYFGTTTLWKGTT